MNIRYRGAGCAIICLMSALSTGCDSQVTPNYEGESLARVNGTVQAALGTGELEVGVLWFIPGAEDLSIQVECIVEFGQAGPSECQAACSALPCTDLNETAAWESCFSACGQEGIEFFSLEESTNLLIAGGVAQTAAVEGEFPARFQLDLLEFPPENAFLPSDSGESLAVGLFVALDPQGAPFEYSAESAAAEGYPPWLLGGSGSHMVVYNSEELTEASDWGQVLQLSLEPGFHLIETSEAFYANEDSDEDAEDAAENASGLTEVPFGEASDIVLEVAPPDTIRWPLTEL